MTGYKNPPWRKRTKFHVTQSNTISKRLRADYRASMSWRAVGAKYGVSGALAYRVAVEGYEPKTAALRAHLGFPVLLPIAACSTCGIVHVAKRCPASRKPAKPRPTAAERRRALALELLGRLHTGVAK